MFENVLLLRHRIRFSLLGKPSLLVWRSRHFKFKYSPCQEIGIGNIHFIVNFSVELCLSNIAVAIVHFRRFYLKSVSIRQIHTDVWKIRCSQHVLIGTRTNGIESHCRKQIPGRHQPAIVIAPQTVNIIFVHPVHHLTHPILCFPGLGSPCIQIGNMMTGFVAMHVPSYQTHLGDIFILFIIFLWLCHREECVQPVDKFLFTTHQPDQSGYIMRHMEREIP